MANRLTVVIPAYNEEQGLPIFLPEVLAHCDEHGYRLVVVNDGSTDGTGALLDELGRNGRFKVIHHKVNRGYGGAIKSGVRAADSDYVITIDADGQHEPGDIDRLLAAIVDENADMIVGGRGRQAPASRYRGFGKSVIRLFARLLMPMPIHDINSGMKIYRTDLGKKYLHLCPNSMPFSDIITLTFINQRHRVLERPITVRRRVGGSSTVNTKTAFETVMEILNILVLFNPMRIFLPVSLFFVVAGVLWGVPIVLRGNGVSVGAMMAIMIGCLLFFLGLIAEQLSILLKSSTARGENDS